MFLWAAVFKPAIGSINGALVPAELKKALAVALSASTVVGGLLAVLNAVLPDVPALFSSPVVASLVTFILTRIVAEVGQLPQSDPLWHVTTLTSPMMIAGVGGLPVPSPAAEALRQHLAYDHGIDADGCLYPALVRGRAYGLTILPADAQPSV